MSIGLVSKYQGKVITKADSEKFDKMINEEAQKGEISNSKLTDIKKTVESQAKNTRVDYRRNYLIYLVYIIGGIVLLNRLEYIICINYNKRLLKKGIKI